MDRMPAVLLTADRDIALVDHPMPARRADQVIVDVDLCGICGSDLHAPELPQVYTGGVVMGHEATGTITWVGDRVPGWTIGQRVALNPNGNIDRTCPQCRAGRFNFCHRATMQTALGLQADGGLAPHVAVFPGVLRALPDSLDRTAAALVEPMATALHAANLAGDLTDKTVLVTGGGTIGQLALRISRARGAAQVLLVEPSQVRRAHGRGSGADAAWDADEAAGLVGDIGADVVIEASGSGTASTLGLDALDPGGVFVVVGAGPGTALDAATILLKEISVHGSFTYVDEFDEAITALADGSLSVDGLAPAQVPIRDALSAFEMLRDAAVLKVLVDPRA
ncbi:zinc-dependent alcohol dehydrogenase [Mycolicibacterium sp.]|uniref:zinc-dependent alcohol dehydrogenase n=1 Tax=Mycolicibacterium sp. TaxID=2320850 RepID=UPI003D0FA6CF